MEHFGVDITNWSYKKIEDKIKEQEILCLYTSLDVEKYHECINKFLLKYKDFAEIKDLASCDFPGWYFIILEKYRQVYIGCSNNIKKRILQHWKRVPPLSVQSDYAMYRRGVFQIDWFGALDTTKIYVVEEKDFYNIINVVNKINVELGKTNLLIKQTDPFCLIEREDKMIKYFVKCGREYICNKVY